MQARFLLSVFCTAMIKTWEAVLYKERHGERDIRSGHCHFLRAANFMELSRLTLTWSLWSSRQWSWICFLQAHLTLGVLFLSLESLLRAVCAFIDFKKPKNAVWERWLSRLPALQRTWVPSPRHPLGVAVPGDLIPSDSAGTRHACVRTHVHAGRTLRHKIKLYLYKTVKWRASVHLGTWPPCRYRQAF